MTAVGGVEERHMELAGEDQHQYSLVVVRHHSEGLAAERVDGGQVVAYMEHRILQEWHGSPEDCFGAGYRDVRIVPQLAAARMGQPAYRQEQHQQVRRFEWHMRTQPGRRISRSTAQPM